MSKKPKEQVKYNPSISGASRVGKCVRAIQGKSVIITAIISAVIMLVCTCGFIYASLTDIPENIKDPSGIGACVYVAWFFTINFISIFAVTPLSRDNEAIQRSALNGCGSMPELFMHLPVKKVDLYKHSFRYYFVALVVQTSLTLFLNTIFLVYSEYEKISAYFSAVSIYLTLFSVLLYILFFDLRPKSDGNKKFHTGTTITFITLAFGIGILLMMGSDLIMKLQGSFVGAYAGVPAITVSVLAAIFVIVMQKAVIEKRAIGTAWYD